MPVPVGSAVPTGNVRVGSVPGGSRDEWVARRSRVAGATLVLVLLAVSVFAVWSSQATSRASAQAVLASGLSDDYARAVQAVDGEESLERKYRVEPGPDVQARYDTTAATFVAALGDVRRDGDASDRSLVDATLARHYAYLAAIDGLFRAIDRGDVAAALRIDREKVARRSPRSRRLSSVLRGASTSGRWGGWRTCSSWRAAAGASRRWCSWQGWGWPRCSRRSPAGTGGSWPRSARRRSTTRSTTR